jgi:hypothetical protein
LGSAQASLESPCRQADPRPALHRFILERRPKRVADVKVGHDPGGLLRIACQDPLDDRSSGEV